MNQDREVDSRPKSVLQMQLNGRERGRIYYFILPDFVTAFECDLTSVLQQSVSRKRNQKIFSSYCMIDRQTHGIQKDIV